MGFPAPSFRAQRKVPDHGNSAASAVAVPAPVPRVEPRHNIKFVDVVYGAKEQTYVLSKFAGQTLTFATAKFVNEAIKGEQLLNPTAKARAIYRRPDGVILLDISNVPWVPGPGNQIYEDFDVNVPRYVLLFSLGYNTRFARSAEPIVARVAGTRRIINETHDYDLPQPIGSVEVQLLTDTEQLYAVLITFIDSDSNLLPYYKGNFREL